MDKILVNTDIINNLEITIPENSSEIILFININKNNLESNIKFNLEKNSNLSIIDIEYNIDNSVKNYEYILGESAKVIHKSALYYKNNNVSKLSTKQIHMGENSSSSVIIKTVLFDQAKATYNSLIKIDKDACESEAIQNHNSLLLSENAQNIATPALEVMCNQVKCKHGSATGYINQGQLIYLKSKGFTEQEAYKTILLGFFHDLLHEIDYVDYNEHIKNFYNNLNLL